VPQCKVPQYQDSTALVVSANQERFRGFRDALLLTGDNCRVLLSSVSMMAIEESVLFVESIKAAECWLME